jgi:hypothetical protein
MSGIVVTDMDGARGKFHKNSSKSLTCMDRPTIPPKPTANHAFAMPIASSVRNFNAIASKYRQLELIYANSARIFTLHRHALGLFCTVSHQNYRLHEARTRF